MIGPETGLFGSDAIALRCWLLVAALALDAAIGDPDWLWRRLPHPVVVVGRLITWLDRRLNREVAGDGWRRFLGGVSVLILVGLAGAIGLGIAMVAQAIPLMMLVEIALVAVFLAQRSLFEHVARVADGLDRTLNEGRQAVAQIVGRDPNVLDRAGVSRAAIESAAENYSDGVVAPAFWYLVLGLPGVLAYKAINTADSMIGHRTARHQAFGWGAARLDDIANLVPARLCLALIVPASVVVRRRNGGPLPALRAAWRDAGRHRSPNAGWPEASTAGALGLALAGPRRYGDDWVDDPYQNQDGDPNAGPDDIRAAIRLLAVAGGVGATALVVMGLFL